MNLPVDNYLRERLETARSACGLTLKAAAIETKTDEKALSAWLQGKPVDGIAELVGAWCNQIDQETAEALPGLVETPTKRRIHAALETARERPVVITIFGAPGSGKTSTLEDFIKDPVYGRADWATYVEAQDEMTAAQLRRLLCFGATGMYDRWAGYEMADRLAEFLLERTHRGRPVIFVDEVQRLEDRLLAGLAWFYNQRNISLVLCGNEGRHSDVHGGKNKELASLSDRAEFRLFLPGPTKDDVDAILSAWNIKGRSERAFMQKVRERLNSLRPITRILNDAARYARMRNVAIDLRVLKGAAVALGYHFE